MDKKILHPTGITIVYILLGAFTIVAAESNSAHAWKCKCCYLGHVEAAFFDNVTTNDECIKVCDNESLKRSRFMEVCDS